MKAMVLTGIREMECLDIPEPTLKGDDDVLIKVDRVGVCGSDVHYYTTGRIGTQIVQYPYYVGHEMAGTVMETGSAVSRCAVGDAVAVDPAMPCFECSQCKLERFHTCEKLLFLGCPGQIEGCLTEYIVMPQTSCFKLTDSTTRDQGVLSEPLAIGYYACTLASSLKGARIGILGSGPIGLSVLLPAQVEGVERVYITDKIDARLAIAQGAGGHWTGNPDSQDIVAAIQAEEPQGLDYVFECCGQQDAMRQAIQILKPGGTLLIVGIPEIDDIAFPIHEMRRKEITIKNVRRQNECTDKTLELMDKGQINADFMITHHYPFDRTKEAFDLVADYQDGVMKAMITFD
jgi:L-iditol 2-dehydrogenase